MQQDAEEGQSFFIYRGNNLLRSKLSLTAFLSPKSSRVSIEDILRPREDPNSPTHQYTLPPTSSTPNVHKINLTGGGSLLAASTPQSSPSFFLHTSQQQPQIYQDAETGSLCVFIGSLNNLNELADIYTDTSTMSGDDNNDDNGDGDGALVAQVLLAMYTKEVSPSSSSSSSSSPFYMLSELQGQYAFLIHDADKRQILAARDSTGACPLYYSMSDDDDIWVASSPLYIPPPPPSTYRGFLHSSSSSSSSATSPAVSPHAFSQGGGSGVFNSAAAKPPVVVPHHHPHEEGAIKWEELPAGYFIFGRRPAKLMQFALSQAQLNMKELELDAEDEKALFGRGGGGGDQQELSLYHR